MNADGISSSDSASPLLHPADEFDNISGLSLNPQSADRGCVCVQQKQKCVFWLMQPTLSLPRNL